MRKKSASGVLETASHLGGVLKETDALFESFAAVHHRRRVSRKRVALFGILQAVQKVVQQNRGRRAPLAVLLGTEDWGRARPAEAPAPYHR